MKVVAEAADVLHRPRAGLVILLYHRVGARTSVSVDLPLDRFDDQMAALAASGRVIALDDAVELLMGGHDVTDRVVVTFDDGTADFTEVVVPVISRHRVPVTLYVATDFVERGRWFPDSGRPATWSGLAEAVATGLVTMGSHTHTHALLDRVDQSRVESELDRSIELIEDRLGVPADHFAYPKALAPSVIADTEVRKRFRSAALAGTRPNPAGTDIHLLARSPLQVDDGRRWFERKVAGGMRLEDELRRLVDRRRHAGAAA